MRNPAGLFLTIALLACGVSFFDVAREVSLSALSVCGVSLVCFGMTLLAADLPRLRKIPAPRRVGPAFKPTPAPRRPAAWNP